MGVIWLEEPLPMYDVDGLAKLATRVEIPISALPFGFFLDPKPSAGKATLPAAASAARNRAGIPRA